MPAEYEVGWYEPDSPVEFDVITDHRGWQPIEPYGVGYLPGCHSGTVESEPGYIRARTLFGDDPTAYGSASNIMALPEPPLWMMNAAAILAVVVLVALRGWRRAR